MANRFRILSGTYNYGFWRMLALDCATGRIRIVEIEMEEFRQSWNCLVLLYRDAAAEALSRLAHS